MRVVGIVGVAGVSLGLFQHGGGGGCLKRGLGRLARWPLFNVLYTVNTFKMLILCPQCGLIDTDSGKDDAIGHRQSQVC